MTTTKFKQPIVFQSRVIDLAEIMEHLDFDVMEDLDGEGFSSPAQWLKTYDIAAGYTDLYINFVESLRERFDIDFPKLKYGKLPRPLALDMCSGELHQIASIDYNRSGEVSSVIVRDGDALKYIYNAILEHSWIPPEALKTELQIMYDGWQ